MEYYSFKKGYACALNKRLSDLTEKEWELMEKRYREETDRMKN
jgi:hypothetical protein